MSTSTSISAVQDFDTCHRKWYYQAHNDFGLGYSPMYERDNMTLGSLYHHAQQLVAQGTPVNEALRVTREGQENIWATYNARPEDADRILDTMDGLVLAHVKWQSRDSGRYSDKNLEIIKVEEKIRFDMEGYEFVFVCDRIVRHKPTGVLLPFEFKVSGYPEQTEAGLPWDMQPRFYCYAVSKLFGEPVPGLIYEFIRATNPDQVTILKDGLPSKAMSTLQGTTYEIYYDTLVECARSYIANPPAKPKFHSVAEIMADYEPILDKARTRVDPIFWRRPHWVTEEEQRRAARDMLAAAKEMEAARALGPDVRPTGLNRSACNAYSGCPFRAPCLLQDQGGDWRGLLESDFIQNKSRL